jgi:hypothetical protein
LGNLWRWTIWGLAAILVVALWLGWSNQGDGPGEEVVATAEPSSSATAEEADDVAVLEVTVDETETEDSAEAVQDEPVVNTEAVENTVEEVRNALESAVGSASEAVESLREEAEAVEGDVRQALEGVVSEVEGVATALEENLTTSEGLIGEEEADLNILSPELSDITVPGDDGSYSLVSIFERDDGKIEVVTNRTENGVTTQTIRLVTCAPLAVGVISEGDGPRNETPELERIPLGSAAATIAALACGAMN